MSDTTPHLNNSPGTAEKGKERKGKERKGEGKERGREGEETHFVGFGRYNHHTTAAGLMVLCTHPIDT